MHNRVIFLVWMIAGSVWDQAIFGSESINLYGTGDRKLEKVGDFFLDEVQPVLAKNCASCHACSEAPCQFKMTSYEGLRRGLSEINPYKFKFGFRGNLLLGDGTEPTVYPDQYSEAEWRNHGFASAFEGEENIFERALSEGKYHNFPGFDATPGAQHIKRECPQDTGAYDKFVSKNPGLGMPLGLPRLAPHEYQTLHTWAQWGYKGPDHALMESLKKPSKVAVIEKWESFLNGSDFQTAEAHVQLVSRFIFEHSFLAHVSFAEMPGEFFRIVRSSTPYPLEVKEVYTTLPYDDPGVGRVYYRLKKLTEVIARKNHVVWSLNDDKLTLFKDLFYGASWWEQGVELPGYDNWNPFENFKAIPAIARYKWMLSNSRLIVDQMTRGPVCVGSSATYVVDDHFWAWFLDPESDPSVVGDYLEGQDSWDLLGNKNQESDRIYRKTFEHSLRTHLAGQGKRGLTLEDLWDGSIAGHKTNPLSAWLNVTRHETNMTVRHGPEGGIPQSIWVISFTHFERMYYDLVASFDAYGDVEHKIRTWQYMSLIRNEGEELYISLFKTDKRLGIHRRYVADRLGQAKHFLQNRDSGLFVNFKRYFKAKLVRLGILSNDLISLGRPGIQTSEIVVAERHWQRVITPDDLTTAHFENKVPRLAEYDSYNNFYDPNKLHQQPFARLKFNPTTTKRAFADNIKQLMNTVKFKFPRYFPNTVFLRVRTPGEHWLYTIQTDRGYKSHIAQFSAKLTRSPEDDRLAIYPGISANYPNLFLDVDQQNIHLALSQLAEVDSKSSWEAFQDTYGVSRNSSRFWPFVEWLNDWQAKNDPIEGGVLDLIEYF